MARGGRSGALYAHAGRHSKHPLRGEEGGGGTGLQPQERRLSQPPSLARHRGLADKRSARESVEMVVFQQKRLYTKENVVVFTTMEASMAGNGEDMDPSTYIAEYTAHLRQIAREETVITKAGFSQYNGVRSLNLGMSGPDEDDWKYDVTIPFYCEDGEVKAGKPTRTVEGRPLEDFLPS